MYLKQPINYTEYRGFIFNVTVSDSGLPSLSATALVTITMIDTNDNRPVFLRNYYNHEIPSDSEVGTLVTVVSAYDSDSSSGSYKQDVQGLKLDLSLRHNTSHPPTHQPLELTCLKGLVPWVLQTDRMNLVT